VIYANFGTSAYGSMLWDSQIIRSGFLSNQLIQNHAQRLLWKEDCEPFFYTLPDITHLHEIGFNPLSSPTKIVKLMKKEHVDAFFETGSLRLHTLQYYREREHAEIGDKSEGKLVLAIRNEQATALIQVINGYNSFTFCAFDGMPENEVSAKFGYDSSFEIVDIVEFARAIKYKLSALEFKYANCVYKNENLLVVRPPNNFRFDRLSTAWLATGEMGQYFIKPLEYRHQQEVRIVWRLASDTNLQYPKKEDSHLHLDIKVPEARKFCRRIE
jgi:hypothetical protein